MYGVFEISGASRYDDVIAKRYHFPRVYLRAAEACIVTGSCIAKRDQRAAEWLISPWAGYSREVDPIDAGLFYSGLGTSQSPARRPRFFNHAESASRVGQLTRRAQAGQSSAERRSSAAARCPQVRVGGAQLDEAAAPQFAVDRGV